MRGIGIFKEYFSEYTDHYILIGGAACSIILNEIGVDFRITKDLDMVLIAENMNEAFARRVWEFIKTGNYEQREQSEKKSELYRFLKRRCGYFLGLFYATNPKFRRYSKGLIAPSDILIRFSLYQCRYSSRVVMNSSILTPAQERL